MTIVIFVRCPVCQRQDVNAFEMAAGRWAMWIEPRCFIGANCNSALMEIVDVRRAR